MQGTTLRRTFLTLILAMTWGSTGHTNPQCGSVLLEAGVTLNKAQYLAMDRSDRTLLLKKAFRLAPAKFAYSNLEVTPFFKAFGNQPREVSDKIYFSAKKALKQYELDSRENATTFHASVLFEPASYNQGTSVDNPWAVLIARKGVNGLGKVIYEPVALYSLERNNGGEVFNLVTDRFQEPIF